MATTTCPRPSHEGAAAVLVTRPLDDAAELGDVTVVRVADGQAALGAVAAGWRRRFSPLVVGITGSIAKTSTKEAAAAVLGAARRTLRTEGNMNNEIGLPLTLLRLGPEHEAAVLEMGMYVGGEIAELAAMARPSIGVVTAVQPVHLSRIGSLEAVERAKGELLEALPADGTAILNEDDPIVARMDGRSVARALRYGFAETAQVRADAVASAGVEGMRFTLRTPAGERPVTIPALGRLSVHNALAGAAVGLAAGLDLDAIAKGLEGGWAAPHRAELVRLRGTTIVDDSYNASPGSVLAALDLLAGLPGRRVAVLGTMLELGDGHESGHVDRRARPRAARSSCSSSSDPKRTASSREPERPASTRGGSTTSRTSRAPWTSFGRACATATRCWSRRRAGSGWTASSTPSGSSSGRPRDDRRAHPGTAAGLRAHRHPHAALHPAAAGPRLRQADPPGGPRDPLRQGRHADDGRPAHRPRGPGHLPVPP